MKSKLEQLRHGECALDYRGSDNLEGLRKVLKHCFPKHQLVPGGVSKYYFMYEYDETEWDCKDLHLSDLPTYPLAEFLEELEALNKEVDWEAKYKELQPFERGVKGRGLHISNGWFDCEYICKWDDKDLVYSKKHGLLVVEPRTFTTENPHKKETVWWDNVVEADYNNHKDEYLLFVIDTDRKVIFAHKKEYVYKLPYRQISDDLQAKFDDPNNTKYIDLTK